MSYRSLKRVLGETHLELKCLFLFGIASLTLTALSFWFYGGQTEQLVYMQNRNTGRLLANQVYTEIHWRHLETKESKELVAEITRPLKLDIFLGARVIRPFATSGDHQPRDEEEHEILKKFFNAMPPRGESDIQEDERSLPEQQEYHYYRAFYAERNCVNCHRELIGPANLKEGDLMAVLKIVMSDKQVQADIQWNNAALWATAIVTAFLLCVASYFIIRYVIAKPVKHLQEVSEQISKGDLEKRADIHTGDEFEELGLAFNRMVRHLIEVQQALQAANADLDSKVDELAQRNMQLYEMNRLKSDFLTTMSHELRTPLNSIIGFSDVLASISSLDEKQRRYLLNIQKSGKVLLEMINDILDLAKLESGKTELRISDFRVEQLIHAQCDMARPLTEKKNIDLVIDIQPGLDEMHQDQGKVQQILTNLLSNAIKFTPEGGRIAIRAARDAAGFLQLKVEDTGVGIAEEDQVVIFEKFRQGAAAVPGSDATTREHSGTGLGLSIVKELCKLLGGEIALQSELGKGSTFTVRLPWRLPPRPPAGDGLPPLSTPSGRALSASLGAEQPAASVAE